jgi:hypothetical protein
MINDDIKKLIKKIENLLKTDDRFIDNGDTTYKQQIKKLYKDGKCKNKSIDLTSLINNQQPPTNIMAPSLINNNQPLPPKNIVVPANELNFDELDRAINALDMERLLQQATNLHKQVDTIMGK